MLDKLDTGITNLFSFNLHTHKTNYNEKRNSAEFQESLKNGTNNLLHFYPDGIRWIYYGNVLLQKFGYWR
jgi:hypothetical protein